MARVKVPIERGFGTEYLPTHDRVVRRGIMARAVGYRLPIFVHARDETEARTRTSSVKTPDAPFLGFRHSAVAAAANR